MRIRTALLGDRKKRAELSKETSRVLFETSERAAAVKAGGRCYFLGATTEQPRRSEAPSEVRMSPYTFGACYP